MRQILLFIVLTLTSLYAGNEIAWEKDYQIAETKSLVAKKPLLLFFTGSDCCGWGMRIKNEIFQSEDFAKEAKERFVFVEVDFPAHKIQDDKIAKQNKLLKERWSVQDLPRLVMVDHHGREIARFGITSLSPKEFGEELLSTYEKDLALSEKMLSLQRATLVQLEDLYRCARQLKRETDAMQLVDVGVERGSPFFMLEKYRMLVDLGKGCERKAIDLRKRLVASDPQNEKKVLFSLALIDFQKLSSEKPSNPMAVIRPLEDYLQQFGGKDKENEWRLEMMIAQFYLESDEWQVALGHAEKALLAAPESKREEIAKSVSYIRDEANLACK